MLPSVVLMRSCLRTLSLPFRSIDAETLEFEINVDGFVSSGGLGGPAILPMALAKMAQLTQAFPDKASPESAEYPTCRRPRATSHLDVERFRSARRQCSITLSDRTSSSG